MFKTLFAVLTAGWAVYLCFAWVQAIRGVPTGNLTFFLNAESPDTYPEVTAWLGDVYDDPEDEPRVGDRIIRCGDRDLRGLSSNEVLAACLPQLERTSSGYELTVLRERDGEVQPTVALYRVDRGGPFFLVIVMLMGLSGVLVGFRAPDSRAGRNFALFALFWSTSNLPVYIGSELSVYVSGVPNILSGYLFFAFVLRFCMLMPEETAWRNEWALRAAWLAQPAVILTPWFFGFASPLSPESAYAVFFLAMAAVNVLAATILIVNYRRASPLGRRQGKWVLFSFATVGATFAAHEITAVVNPELARYTRVLTLSIALVPFAVAIAVMRFNLFDIDRVIGATAAFATTAALLLVVAGLLVPYLGAGVGSALGMEAATGHLLVTLALAAVILPSQRLVRPWIDRTFFRERVALLEGFDALVTELTSADSRRPLLTRVGEQLEELLHPESMAVYAQSAGSFAPVFAAGQVPGSGQERTLAEALDARSTPLARARGGARRSEPMTPFERAALETLEAEVVLPLRRRGNLDAFISLGSKRSGDVYTSTDLALLGSLADKASLKLSEFDEEAVEEPVTPTHLEASTERRLAAIMFTDIVGSTAVTARSEPAGLALRDRHRELVRSQVTRYRGRFIEAPGDESLSTFESAVDVVHAALAILQQLDEDPELHVRIGIHTGETVFRGDEVFGDGVNLAARIRELAEPGQILVSAEVAYAVQNQPGVNVTQRGEHKLKGIDRPVAVHSITGSPGVPSDRPTESSSATEIRSIAVLPLENLSGDPEQEYFSDGMTEALISEFARIQALNVISRTSVMQYKRARRPLPEIAQELGVDAVVEGTVLRAGDRVRITVQLIDARSDRHLWADRYDRDLSDVLALHTDVARSVAEQVQAELSPEERAVLSQVRTVDPRAYDAYLRGRAVYFANTLAFATQWIPEVIQELEQAVEIDPNFAEAWAALANCYLNGGQNLRERGELEKTRAYVRKALEADDRQGLGHCAHGWLLLRYDWDFDGARRAFERAVELSPGEPGVLDSYVWSLLGEEKTEEALTVSGRMMLVAPMDIFYRAQHARHFFWARQYDHALREVERVHETFPDFADPDISYIYFKLGRLEEAHRARMDFFKQGGPEFERAVRAEERGWEEGGWEGAIRGILELMEAVRYPLVGRAWHHALIEQWDEVLECLEDGYRERDPFMDGLLHPLLDPIRSDPRLQDLARRIGYPGAP